MQKKNEYMKGEGRWGSNVVIGEKKKYEGSIQVIIFLEQHPKAGSGLHAGLHPLYELYVVVAQQRYNTYLYGAVR